MVAKIGVANLGYKIIQAVHSLGALG